MSARRGLCTTPMVILATLHQRICRSEAWVLTHQPPVYIVQMLPTSSLLLIRQPYATTLPPLLCDRIASVRRVNTMWGSAGTCIASHISSQFIKFLLFRPLAVEKGAPGSYWFFMRAARNGHVRLTSWNAVLQHHVCIWMNSASNVAFHCPSYS
jgi:hypothetical protein